jgi:tetratricopeptide (TPR) repeat protein
MALRLFEQALERDLNHPLAYCGLAEVYRLLSYFGALPPRQGMPKAKAAALRAIELDDTLAEAHVSLANILYFYDWDWAGAEREFQRALALEPQSAEARTWYGFFLWARLRHEQALAELQKAAELDPFSPLAIWKLSWPLASLGRYDELLDLARKLLQMDPGLWLGHMVSAYVKWQKGMLAEAVQGWEKAAAIEGGPLSLGFLCWFYGRTGMPSEAQHGLEQLQQMAQQRYVQPVWLAIAYDAVRAKDQARACIQRAIEEHDLALVHIRGWHGWFPSLLEDCLPLLEKAGL